eukprot:TRINITY_DN1111_c0_g1_i1.p2 TRINITY_DN1111_c0_g1~~TRINITY_DN1111_c0_g1_i1.p2  ORF type:complete len:160 (+),score=41.44 TRINITY_DN1111_c0_g1_i1:60-482(+)
MATATVVTYRQAGASGVGLLVMAFIFFGCSYIWEYDYNLFWTLQVVSYAFFFFAVVSMCYFASLRRRAAYVQYVVTDNHHHHCHDQQQVIYAQPAYGQQPIYAQQPVYAQPSYVSPPPQQASVPAYNPQYPAPPSNYYKV